MMAVTDNNEEFRIQVRDGDGNNPYNVEDPAEIAKIVNGSWNKILWIQAPTTRLFELNGNLLIYESGNFNVSGLVENNGGAVMDLSIAADNEWPLVPGAVRNLCIQSRIRSDFTSTAAGVLSAGAGSASAGSASAFSAGSSGDVLDRLGGEHPFGGDDDDGATYDVAARPNSVNEEITLSTATWINLWGIVLLAMAVNIGLGLWCLRKRTERRSDDAAVETFGHGAVIEFKENF